MISKTTYISSDLQVINKPNNQGGSNNQMVLDEKLFVVLSPEVYAWLRQQMEKARAAYKSGKLAESSWNTLRERFYPVHDLVIKTWGREVVEKALKKPQKNLFVKADRDNTVSNHLYPPDGDWPCICSVSSDALAKVNAIRDKALAVGWTRARLYQNRGRFSPTYGFDYGLVCCLEKDDRLGEVTRQYIEIFRKSGRRENRLCFYNYDVDQPWMKRKR